MVTMEYTDLTVRQMQERTQALQDKYGAEVLASAVMIALDEVYDTNRAVLAAVEKYCHEIHRWREQNDV